MKQRHSRQLGDVSTFGTAFFEFGMKPVSLSVSALFGLWVFSALAASLNPENAKGHIGETATVCGVVAVNVHASGGVFGTVRSVGVRRS